MPETKAKEPELTLHEQIAAFLKIRDEEVVDPDERDDYERSATTSVILEMIGIDHEETCIACMVPFKEGDRYLPDASGGNAHQTCIGPERECFTKDGEPLGPDDPIPEGYVWTKDPAFTHHTADLAVLAREVKRHTAMAESFAAGPAKDLWTGSAESLRRIHDTFARIGGKESAA